MHLVALLLAAALVPVAAGDGVRLQVQAGLGGVARAGHWLPVRITVQNAGPDVDGELIVEWGDARLHRAIALPSPSRTQIEIYVRTIDVRDRVVVRVIAGGQVVATADAGVRVVGDDEPVRVCVTSTGSGDADCTTMIAPEGMPQSMRGYDAADVVTWSGAADAPVTRSQRVALQRWRAYRALRNDDLLATAPHAIWDSGAAASRRPGLALRAALAVYVVVLIGLALVWRRRSRTLPFGTCTVVVAITVTTAAAALAGRIGPGAAIVLRHATTVQQIADASMVTLRGRLEYPAFGNYEVTSTVADGTVAPAFDGSAEQWVDAQGMPLRRGTRALGASEDVEYEGVADYAPFRITSNGAATRVTNVSTGVLSSCRIGEGASARPLGSLAPGAAIDVPRDSSLDAAWLTCGAAVSPVRFVDPRFAVREAGPVVVSVALASGRGERQ